MDITATLREIYEYAELVDAGRADEADIDRMTDLIEYAYQWVNDGGFKPVNFDRVMRRARRTLMGDAD